MYGAAMRRPRPQPPKPIRLGDSYRQRFRRERIRKRSRQVLALGAVLLVLFGAVLLLSNGGLDSFRAAMSTSGEGDCILVSVHDGDTIRCDGEKIRVANIDAPELEGSPRCERTRAGKNPSWCDYELGIKSRDALDDFLNGGTVRIQRLGTDQYGRTLARLNVDGTDAGEHLMSLGLARALV